MFSTDIWMLSTVTWIFLYSHLNFSVQSPEFFCAVTWIFLCSHLNSSVQSPEFFGRNRVRRNPWVEFIFSRALKPFYNKILLQVLRSAIRDICVRETPLNPPEYHGNIVPWGFRGRHSKGPSLCLKASALRTANVIFFQFGWNRRKIKWS